MPIDPAATRPPVVGTQIGSGLTIRSGFLGPLGFRLGVVATVCSPLLVGIVTLSEWFVHRTSVLVADGDIAVLELYTLQATRGVQLLGPYSRFGWHHPGPMFPYLLAPLYALTGHDPVSLQVTSLLIALTSAIALLVVTAQCGTRSVTYSAFALVSVLLTNYGTGFFDFPWNPFVTILPFALLLFLCIELSCGRMALLPLVVVTSSFVLQTHISYLPEVAIALILTGSIVVDKSIRHRLGLPENRATISPLTAIGSSLLVVALWAPSVVEELTSKTGNLTTIYQFYITNRYPIHDLRESFSLLAHQIVGPLLFVTRLAHISETDRSSDLLFIVLTALQVSLAHVAMYAACRLRWGYRAVLATFACVEFWVALWATTHIAGDLIYYLVSWSSIVGLIQWIAIASVLIPVLTRQIGVHQRALETTGLAIATIIILGSVLIRIPRSVLSPGFSPTTAAKYAALTSRLDDYLTTHSGERVFVENPQTVWPVAAAIIVSLEKQGYEVTVSEPWLFMFGDPMRSDGTEELSVLITDPSPGSAPRGWNVVAEDSDTAVYAREDPVAAITRSGGPGVRAAYRVGEDLILSEAAPVERTYGPGETVGIRVKAIVLSDLHEHYMLEARLVRIGGEMKFESSTPISPLDRSPDLIRGDEQEYSLSIPLPPDAPHGVYQVQLLAFTIPAWSAVPITRLDGVPSGSIDAGSILIASPSDIPSGLGSAQSVRYHVGAAIDLIGLGPLRADRGALAFDLFWRASTKPDRDYTFFTQLLNQRGELVAQSDGFPWGGGYPTSSWLPGQIVRDSYHLIYPAALPEGTYRLIVGAYRLDTMERLAVVDASGSPIGDSIPLTRVDLRGF